MVYNATVLSPFIFPSRPFHLPTFSSPLAVASNGLAHLHAAFDHPAHTQQSTSSVCSPTTRSTVPAQLHWLAPSNSPLRPPPPALAVSAAGQVTSSPSPTRRPDSSQKWGRNTPSSAFPALARDQVIYPTKTGDGERQRKAIMPTPFEARGQPGAQEGAELLRKRWSGWQTETYTSYVTATDQVPTAVTIYTTYGESQNVDGGTTTITKYQGASTLTVEGPSYLTLTFYPTSTTYHTTVVTTPTTTKTRTHTPTASSTANVCNPGDASKKEHTGLTPTHDQSLTLYVIAIYLVGIAVGWNLIGLRELLYPFKILTIATHEVGHILGYVCFNLKIEDVTFSPEEGGLVRLAPAVVTFPEEGMIIRVPDIAAPVPGLVFGYLFNIIIGGLLTYCGFDTLASKIASFLVGLAFLGVAFHATTIGQVMIAAALGLMASALRRNLLNVCEALIFRSVGIRLDFGAEQVTRRKMGLN
ncbi:hypothetical protein P7C70_g7553, partial [Phenoliferia sp. Uapishka_3]